MKAVVLVVIMTAAMLGMITGIKMQTKHATSTKAPQSTTMETAQHDGHLFLIRASEYAQPLHHPDCPCFDVHKASGPAAESHE